MEEKDSEEYWKGRRWTGRKEGRERAGYFLYFNQRMKINILFHPQKDYEDL